jgi:hypothetical protein
MLRGEISERICIVTWAFTAAVAGVSWGGTTCVLVEALMELHALPVPRIAAPLPAVFSAAID